MTPFALNEQFVNIILINFMVSIRILALFLTSAAFTFPSVPNQIKFWLSVALAVAVTPLVNVNVPGILLGNWVGIFVMGGREFIIGAFLGVISSMPMYALQASGSIDGMIMGFSMMNMFDPMSQSQASVIAQIKYLLAVWFFLHWDGHFLLLRALIESVRLIPPGVSLWINAVNIPWTDWLQRMFVLALRLNLPICGAVLLADVGLGFVARTVPQMNVFVLGIPLKICVGFFVLMSVLPSCVDIFHAEIEPAVTYALEGLFFWR
ncbi:flagellar biosynthetic protein FliR [Synergistales bacterium]|nr:flagellar biosynthetic protein FliR [Synergistales bacterium]